MTKIIVDTNIVFSALLNINSKIGQILIRGGNLYDFYAPKYIVSEISYHKGKIKSLGKLNEKSFIEVYRLVTKNITILNHSVIPLKSYISAEEICSSIDADDAIFIAFSQHLDAKIWSGDKKLISGLLKMGFDKVIMTEDLYNDFIYRLNSK